jgi:hypothetical protein
MTDDKNNSWTDEFDIPLYFRIPAFTDIQVDDGSGNGNGIPEAGESIMIYTGDHRTRLYTNDPYVVASEEELVDQVLPATWPDGYTLSSVIRISEDCPDGHSIRFLASYETKEQMPIKRSVHWGRIHLEVSNQ